MTVIRRLGLAGLAVLALPVLAIAQDTSYDFDRTAPFGQYHTYAFKEGTSSGDRLIDDRIVAALEMQLGYKGLTKTDTSPDVYVVFHMAYDKQQDISAYSYGPMYGGYGWGWGYGWGSTFTDVRVRDILIGTLAVDMVDAKRGQVVWRGIATKEVDTDEDPHDRDKHVTKAVYKIFKHYPPGLDED
jgi:hypothetical protein